MFVQVVIILFFAVLILSALGFKEMDSVTWPGLFFFAIIFTALATFF